MAFKGTVIFLAISGPRYLMDFGDAKSVKFKRNLALVYYNPRFQRMPSGFCSAGSVDRIMGGTPTTIETYPSLAQVESSGMCYWTQNCAASILTSRYVMSAAHCFDGPTFSVNSRRIRAGTTERHFGGQVVGVECVQNHPSYNVDVSMDSDICVVRTSAALVWSPSVQQGAIPYQGYQVPDNAPVIHAGWGAVSYGGPASLTLLHTTIYTVNHELCVDAYINMPPTPGNVTINMICAGIFGVGGADACTGDSGGTLYYGNFIVGVVSWGHQCVHSLFPGISTAVSSYTNWILATAV